MLKSYMRKAIAVIVLLGSILSIPTVSMAATAINSVDQQEADIAPYMTYIVEWKNGLTISGGTATVDCWVNGDVSSATKAKVIAELQLKSGNDNWIPVAIWTDTQNGFEASVYETKTVTTGNTYRVKATYTVWEGTQSETMIEYTREVTA